MATTMTVPDVVVSTDWVAQHRNDATVRIVGPGAGRLLGRPAERGAERSTRP